MRRDRPVGASRTTRSGYISEAFLLSVSDVGTAEDARRLVTAALKCGFSAVIEDPCGGPFEVKAEIPPLDGAGLVTNLPK